MYSYQDFAKAVFDELKPGETFEEWDGYTFYSSEPPMPEMTFCERWFMKGNAPAPYVSTTRITSWFSSHAPMASGKSSRLTRTATLRFSTKPKPRPVRPGPSCWANKPMAQG